MKSISSNNGGIFSGTGKRIGRVCLWCGLWAGSSVFGQDRANVSIDLSKAINILTETSLAVPAPTFDGNNFNPAGAPYLRAAGITAVRFPGNHGVADLYHWSTKTTTKYKGSEPAYVAPEANFGSFALFAEKLGQAVIVVNYGANLDGAGGGEPAEAAAWVAYANGEAADTRPLGKDSTGEDWKTVGFWAALRGEEPLAADDGFNFLRLRHPRPFAFRLWQVGDEVYNNGFYGGDHTGDPDLHGPAPTAAKDFSRLKNDAKLSPAAFGENVKAFAAAMKAVDPTIGIGVALTVPPDVNGQYRDPVSWAASLWEFDWNKNVLKTACGSLDFVTLESTLQPLLPPDYKTLNEPDLLSNTAANFNAIQTPMLEDYAKYCPKGHYPRLAMNPAGIASWPRVEHPVVTALWVADSYALMIESGAVDIAWSEMYGNSMLSSDRKKFGPAYYGLQMLHILARNPGDALVDAVSSNALVGAHATRRRDGFVGLMLVNKDLKNEAQVKVTFRNGTVGTAGKRFDYGAAQFNAGTPVSATPFTGTGNELTVTVPPYTVTDILLPEHN